MKTSPALHPSQTPQADDDLVHLMCCVDRDLALCGLNIADLSLSPRHEPLCVACGVEERRAEGCPKFGRCIEDVGVLS